MSPSRILIVDDSKFNRSIISNLVSEMNLSFDMAENGKEALEKLKESNYDLIMLDLEMPVMNGEETLFHLKKDEDLNTIPVIIITAVEDVNRAARFIEMGAEDYITKPFHPVFLEARISTLLQKKKFQDYKNNEITKAKRIQKNLLPATIPELSKARFSCFYRPIEQIGGDFYDFIKIGEPHITGIFISDTSGHGIPAAFITSMVKVLIEVSGSKRLSPSELLTFLNEKLINLTDENFLTAFYCLFNENTMQLSYSRAAHPPPILIRDDRLIHLSGKGRILALFENVEFEEKTIQLREKDKIIMYTDGLTEAINQDKKEFESRFHQVLVQMKSEPIEQVIETIVKELYNYTDRTILEDDVCILGMEIL